MALQGTADPKKVIEALFNIFYQQLEEKGLIAEKGVLVDASVKDLPIGQL